MLIKRTTIEYEYDEQENIVKSIETIEEFDDKPAVSPVQPYKPYDPYNPYYPWAPTTPDSPVWTYCGTGDSITVSTNTEGKDTYTTVKAETPSTFTSGYVTMVDKQYELDKAAKAQKKYDDEEILKKLKDAATRVETSAKNYYSEKLIDEIGIKDLVLTFSVEDII